MDGEAGGSITVKGTWRRPVQLSDDGVLWKGRHWAWDRTVRLRVHGVQKGILGQGAFFIVLADKDEEFRVPFRWVKQWQEAAAYAKARVLPHLAGRMLTAFEGGRALHWPTFRMFDDHLEFRQGGVIRDITWNAAPWSALEVRQSSDVLHLHAGNLHVALHASDADNLILLQAVAARMKQTGGAKVTSVLKA